MKKLGKFLPSILAGLIGVMSIITGSSVLLGVFIPDYEVLQWLVIYNVILGIASVIVAIKLWKKLDYRWPAMILVSHLIVLALLLAVFTGSFATDSLQAMTFRMLVWSTILSITYLVKDDSEKVVNVHK